MTLDNLITTPELRRLDGQEKLCLETSEGLLSRLHDLGGTAKDAAMFLGISVEALKDYISDGEIPLRLVHDLAMVCGCKVKVTITPCTNDVDYMLDAWVATSNWHSSPTLVERHPLFGAITKSARRVEILKNILGRMQKGDIQAPHWFSALRKLSDGARPVPPEHAGHIQEMAKAWLDWGLERGLIKPQEAAKSEALKTGLRKNQSSPEGRAFWAAAEKIAKEVRGWSAWKRRKTILRKGQK